jgi:predicted nucleotidyltransferase
MTTRLERALARAAADLSAERLEFAVIGGLAVSVRAEPRLTRDFDLAVAIADDAAAEHAVRALLARGYVTVGLVEQASTRRIATVRLVTPGESAGGIVADLLFASSGIEPEIVAAAEPIEVLPGLRVPVARIGHLIALKLLARDDRQRPQDADDLAALRRVADASEIDRARFAVRLIGERGFHRGRDLAALLGAWIAASEPPSGL